jgi:RNA polymerase sigma factor (sigma-70 family)
MSWTRRRSVPTGSGSLFEVPLGVSGLARASRRVPLQIALGNREAGSGKYSMMGPVPTDAEAIGASRSDPQRFAVVFDRHFATLHRFLRRRVGQDLADDLAAETFARAFGARGRYDLAHDDARPWLFGIAANLLRRHRRTEQRRLLAHARMPVHVLSDPELDSAEGRLDAQAMVPRLAEALATLHPGQREVLFLFAWADLTYVEIARALSLPIGTVQSRLARARIRLREQLPGFRQEQDESDTRETQRDVRRNRGRT